MIEGGEDSLVDLGNFATAVKAKQGATTDIDRGLNTNALLKISLCCKSASYVVRAYINHNLRHQLVTA